MSKHSNKPHVSHHHWAVFVPVGLAAILGACATFVPRQGWNPDYGPVVPHDTFPADCSLCHVSGNWTTIKAEFSFDHELETGTALHGAHRNVSCLLCHNDRGPVATFAARGCAGCHPDIHRGKLGRMCEECHHEQSWVPRDMIARHARTRFPLVGAHTVVACYVCHPGAQVGNFEGLDINCSSCHLSEYLQTTSPNHQASGFSTSCQDCHNQISWRGANLGNHPFPLSGPHGGLSCSSCHLNPGTYQQFSCTHCHAHNQSSMDNEHDDVPGYVWSSPACLDCHPDGRD